MRGRRCQDDRRPDQDEDVGRVHPLAIQPDEGGSPAGREDEAPVERCPGGGKRPGPGFLDGRGDRSLPEEGNKARDQEAVNLRQSDVEHRDGERRDGRERGRIVVLRAVFQEDREPVERERACDEAGVSNDVPDAVQGEAESRVREAECRRPDDDDTEDNGVYENQILARSLLEEVEDELDQSEGYNDECEENHRRHVEEPEEVRDTGESRCDNRDLQGLNILRGERPVACREQRRDVGEDEDRREECLRDMVVDEPEEGSVGVVAADDRNQARCDEAGLPVGNLSREQVDDRDHRDGHQRRNPGRDQHDLGARRRAGEDAERCCDLNEERSPVDDVAGRVECHGVEPGVAGEVRDALLHLAEAVPGVVAEEIDAFGGHQAFRRDAPRPEREQGE